MDEGLGHDVVVDRRVALDATFKSLRGRRRSESAVTAAGGSSCVRCGVVAVLLPIGECGDRGDVGVDGLGLSSSMAGMVAHARARYTAGRV